MKIGKYFTLEEMYYSEKAKLLKINNQPTPNAENNLCKLVANLLDPLREAWGSPIIVTSGFRCTALNDVISKHSKSAHTLGLAADLVPKNGAFTEFRDFVFSWLQDKPFDQYIEEFVGNSRWIHIGLTNLAGTQRREFLHYNGKKYIPIEGVKCAKVWNHGEAKKAEDEIKKSRG